MSLLSPAFLLAVAFFCAASSTPTSAIAHDSHAKGGLQNFQTMQQRQMTSSLLTNLALASGTGLRSAMPFAAGKLGRNLPNNLERQQHQQQQHQQPNAKGNKDNDNKDSFVAVRSSSSVVQDWSLVCKQLCGASLGGEPCAAECSINNDRIANATRSQNTQHRIAVGNVKYVHAIFELRRAAICVDLCEVGLGGKTCNCSTNETLAIKEIITGKNFNIVCSSFCGYAGTTLKGCSPCHEKSLFDASIENAIMTISKANDLKYAKAIAPRAATSDTATPDWDVLCASLCKTGDGGSLCNCDLSPFFK